MSSLLARGNAIIRHTGVDFTDKTGYLAKENSGVLAVNDSASAPARAVILEGNASAKESSIGIIGALTGPVRLVAGGAITKYNQVIQKNDGTVVADTGSGARVAVGIALETAASGAFVEVALQTPTILS